MIDVYEVFFKHILNMSVFGIDAPPNIFDPSLNVQKSIYFDGTIYYKIYASFEDYENDYNSGFYNTNPNVIPALIISTPELYFKGLIPYKGGLLSIRNILDSADSTSTLPKINLFIIPLVETTGNQFLGSGKLSIYVDYNTYYDIYGLFGKDLAEVINYRYYQNKLGEYFYLDGQDNVITNRFYRIFFIPKTVDVVYDRTVLNRVKYIYTIRYTSVVKGEC